MGDGIVAAGCGGDVVDGITRGTRMIKHEGYRDRRAARYAEKCGRVDARNEHEFAPNEIVLRLINIRPESDPARDPLLVQWERDSQPHPEYLSWVRALDAAEKSLTHYSSRWLFRALFGGLVLAEFAGITHLLAHEGMQNPERSIVAFAGACILFFLTYKAAQSGKRKTLWYYLTCAAIALVIFAVTVLRHDETTTAESSALTNAASSIFLAVLTLGPGLLAKEGFLRLFPVAQLSRDRRRLRRKIHRDEQKCSAASYKREQRALP